MTWERREEILSKDLITTEELGELLGMPYAKASELLNDIKRSFAVRGVSLRLDIRGRLHTQDYLDYFHITPDNIRYARQNGKSIKQGENL